MVSKVTPSILIGPELRRGTLVGVQFVPCVTSSGDVPRSGWLGPNTAIRSLAGESSISKRTVNTERISAFRWRPARVPAVENQVIGITYVPRGVELTPVAGGQEAGW